MLRISHLKVHETWQLRITVPITLIIGATYICQAGIMSRAKPDSKRTGFRV